ncbi:MAG: exonuclease domain-containing protein [Burkholderiales bacterium]
MQLFAPSLAFVDLETTGTHAVADRITEVGIVRVDADAGGGPPRVREWSSLVDPEVPIPPVIQALTGITDAMVAGAPTFSAIADTVAEQLADCVFIAHNARFDHGFLKHAFARIGRPFAARALCTVRLSRRLFPDADGHGLDAVVARHGLAVTDRHRALGDARAVWAFMAELYRTLPAETIEAAVRRILRIPSLPPQLPPDSLDLLPETPGVYLFYGDNPLPIYIGKSVNLRERVASHFAGDWRNETDLRLSQEIRRIEFEPTAGELGALLRESVLVKSLMPAHNRALRRKDEAGVLSLAAGGAPEFVPAALIDPSRWAGRYGPFTSKRAARESLRSLAALHRLCWRRLGLEKRAAGPCFARQVRRCAGVCVGAEDPAEHDARLAAALAPAAIPAWPFAGVALVREASADGERVDVHAVRDWCWLGTARDDGELARLLEAPPRVVFDIDVMRLLLTRWEKGSLALVAVPDALTTP